MLVVKVEVWPFGDEGSAYEIDRLFIANDGWAIDGSEVHRYGVFDSYDKVENYSRREEDGSFANVPTVYHSRLDGALELIRKAIEAL